ncbi:hypothetical protein GCM10023160_17570 [Brachybacterium paraconglomeratum]
MGTSAARATTTSATRARVRRVMVIPGPSSGALPALLPAAGRAAATGPRERAGAAFLAAVREVAAAGREEARVPGRRPPDAATGRLVDRGAPGRLLVMARGYNLELGTQEVKRGKAEAPA